MGPLPLRRQRNSYFAVRAVLKLTLAAVEALRTKSGRLLDTWFGDSVRASFRNALSKSKARCRPAAVVCHCPLSGRPTVKETNGKRLGNSPSCRARELRGYVST